MCVRTIIDASAFRHLHEQTTKTAGHQLRRWITSGPGLVVYAEDLAYGNELKKNLATFALLTDFRRRGRAERITAAEIRVTDDGIPQKPTRRSNDPHVLALAAAGQATVLFSCDSDLQQDFSDRRVLPNVGTQRRSSVPLRVHEPYDTTDAHRRSQFFATRRCAARRNL